MIKETLINDNLLGNGMKVQRSTSEDRTHTQGHTSAYVTTDMIKINRQVRIRFYDTYIMDMKRCHLALAIV